MRGGISEFALDLLERFMPDDQLESDPVGELPDVTVGPAAVFRSICVYSVAVEFLCLVESAESGQSFQCQYLPFRERIHFGCIYADLLHSLILMRLPQEIRKSMDSL